MRCPYCGNLNSERASFCVSCGRDVTVPSKQPAQRQQPPSQQSRPAQPRPVSPGQGYPTQGRPAPGTPQQTAHVRQQDIPAVPTAPDAPAPFPPKTLVQLHMLEQGALAYTVGDTTTNGVRKKIVRIVYPRCVAWQQAATLLKALKEQQETRFESIIIQGYRPQDMGGYTFTNGQLTFDRNVRLGSQTLDRYLIETGNGFESDSVRIVLSE